VDSHELYTTERAILADIITRVCRRRRLARADAEDFSNQLLTRLINADYATFRQFEGRSALRTYLVVVVTHALEDWYVARFGRWRQSTEATRLGPLAVTLERLLQRDGYSIDEAHEFLRTNAGVTASRQDLTALAAQLRERQRRIFVSDAILANHPSPGASTDAELAQARARVAAEAASAALARALRTLTPRDQLVLRLRFHSGLEIPAIARTLHADAKSLYRRISQLMRELRRALEADGVTAEAAAEAMAHGGFDRAPPGAPAPAGSPNEDEDEK
jgi:RNA polymerase sigma factor (sigma-70 family)